jgi:hypothetical protein
MPATGSDDVYGDARVEQHGLVGAPQVVKRPQLLEP